MFRYKMLFLGSLFAASSGYAATISLDQLTSDQLLAPYTQRCQGDSSCLNSRFIEPVNITVSPLDLSYGDVEYSGLPVSVDSRVYTVRNCTSVPRVQSTSFGTTKVSGIVVETKDSVIRGQKSTRDIDLKFTVKSFKLGSTLKSSYEKTVDFSTANVTENTVSTAETVKLNTTVPPYTVKMVKYNSIALTGKLPLTATGRISGTTRFGDYSAIVPSPVMTLSGELLAFEHNEIRQEFYEFPQGNATACRNFSLPATTTAVHAATSQKGLPLIRTFYHEADEVAALSVVAPSPLLVRVKLAAGSSACPVTFNFGRDQIAVLGRAGVWSDWQALSVVNADKQYLTTSHQCAQTPEIQYSLATN